MASTLTVSKDQKESVTGPDGVQRAPEGADSFFWTYTEEPHRTRRQAIIRAHPEILKLCGPEPLTKYCVVGVVALQILIAFLLKDSKISSPVFIASAYLIGATANQNLFLAIHEISHNLAFKSAQANRLAAIVANFPIGIPYSAAFRPYHLTHHKSLGVDGLDTDIPTALEAAFFDSVLGKAFFCTFQIFFYAIRPMAVYNIPITQIHLLNILAQTLFDITLYQFTGMRGIAYLLMSSFFAGSLHPCAGHFIAEHYVFKSNIGIPEKNKNDVPLPETFSYYGPLNILTYNVGYHNEHHDFPAIAWTKLPKLHRIAAEFYKPLPHHTSWTMVLWQFIWDEDVSLWCRVKRKGGGRKVDTWLRSELGANEARTIPGVR